MSPQDDRWLKRRLERRLAGEFAAANEAYRLALLRLEDYVKNLDEIPMTDSNLRLAQVRHECQRTHAAYSLALSRWTAFVKTGEAPEDS